MTDESPKKTIPVVKIQRLDPEKNADIPLPAYMTPHASGMDISASIDDAVTLEAGAITVIPTGIAIALPTGFEAQVRPRSGLAFKHGIGIINSPGTIDADYRGEVRIALINWGRQPFTIHRGDRIAQLVIQQVNQVQWELVNTLDKTERSEGGFGHTGL